LGLIVAIRDERPVGSQEQPQRRQGEETDVDGRSQSRHVAPRFFPSADQRPVAVIVHNDTDNPIPSRGVA
jgi:hypothetical protein